MPAVVLAALGKPSAFSIAVGLPLAFAGEAIRAWAVGYSGVTTRGDRVTAPALVTAGPVRLRAQPALRRQLRHGARLRASPSPARTAPPRAPRSSPARSARCSPSTRRRAARRALPARDLRRRVRRVRRRRCRASCRAPRRPAASRARYDPAVIGKRRVAHVPHVRRDAARAGVQGAQSDERPRRARSARHAAAEDRARGDRARSRSLELAGGIVAHSLALLSDAAHVTMDVVALDRSRSPPASSRRARRTSARRSASRGSRSWPASATARCSLAVTVLIVGRGDPPLHASRAARAASLMVDHRGDRPGRERRRSA